MCGVLFKSTAMSELFAVFTDQGGKFHSVWQLKMWNSCSSVVHNTCACEQQGENKTEIEEEKEEGKHGNKQSGHKINKARRRRMNYLT